MITYQVEQLADCLSEIELLLQDHFQEIATNKDKLEYAKMDVESYVAMERAGQLHIVTVRSKGKVVGYHVAFVRPHLHYVHVLSAITDVYYVKPEYRRGLVGVRLFREAEFTLKARGVKRIFSGTKLHKNMGRLFEYLGWQETERLYCKWIGD